MIGSNIRMNPKQLWAVAKEAVHAWSDDYAPSMGAALAYYTLFSIAPLLLIAIAIAGFVFGEDAARGQIAARLHDLMGEQGAQAVQALLQDVHRPAEGILATLGGVVALVIGAMSVFGELQNSLDRIWRAPAPPGGASWLTLVRARLHSFGMVIAVGVLLIVSLLVSAVLAAIGRWWSDWFAGWTIVAQLFDLLLAFGLLTLGFAMVYKIVPRVRIEWHDVWIGAAVTAALFTIGKFVLGFYLGRATFASGFGAAASLVVMMAWVYYSAQVFLLGAEFTWVYAHVHGSRRAPGAIGGLERTAATGDPIAALAASRAAISANMAREPQTRA